MRIIAGQWRGRPLIAPTGDATRPTADRTRETLFSMLTSRLGDWEGLRVLDLFAGSGALGLEALSRGAAHASFVEQDAKAISTITGNIAKIAPQADTKLLRQSVMTLGAATQPYDVILADPPYHTGAGAVAIDRLARLGWIGPASWVVIETAADEHVRVAGFDILADRKVGRAKLFLLRMAATG